MILKGELMKRNYFRYLLLLSSVLLVLGLFADSSKARSSKMTKDELFRAIENTVKKIIESQSMQKSIQSGRQYLVIMGVQ